MIRSESRTSLTCISEVHVLSPLKKVLKRVRGGLYSKQYKIVSSEITGRVPVPKHPGTDKECSA
jgi:hypothetical protein